MRIAKLDLIKFGPFENQTIDFGSGPFGLHLIYGPNEAGKSTALRALICLLYGIPSQTDDNFRFPYSELRIGAVLEDSHGQPVEVIRRKGKSKTLRGPNDDTIVDDALLTQLLGNVDEASFKTQFGIDHQELKQGGDQILDGAGDLGGSLFAAGAGLARLHDVRKSLQQDAERLFKPSGTKPPLNAALKRFKDAKKKVREKSLAATQWQRLYEELRVAKQKQSELVERRKQIQAQRSRLERLQTALPDISQRSRVRKSLAALADVPSLPDDFSERRQQAQTERDKAGLALQSAESTIESLQKSIDDLPPVSTELLERAASIETLVEERGAIVKAKKDQARLQISLAEKRTAVQRWLQELGREEDDPDAESLRVTDALRRKVKEMSRDHQTLQKDLETSRTTLNTLQAELAAAQNKLQASGEPVDTSELERLIAQIQRNGDLEQRRRELAAEVERLERQTNAALQRLPLFDAPLSELVHLALPSPETIDQFETKRGELDQQLKSLNQQLDDIRRDIEDTNQRLTSIQTHQDVPTESELERARAERDAVWKKLVQFIERPAASKKENSGSTDRASTIEEYEDKLREADYLADRLRREADAVATKANQVAQLKKLESRRTSTEQTMATVETAIERWEDQWRQAWSGAGLEPRSPREMRAWLQARNELVQQADELEQTSSDLQSVIATIDQLKRDMEQCLASLGQAATGDRLLEDWCDMALRFVKEQSDLRRSREQLASEIDRLKLEIEKASHARQEFQRQWAVWQTTWADLMASIALAPDSSPDSADAMIEKLGKVNATFEEIADLERRITGIARDAARFQQRTRAILEATGLEPHDDAARSVLRLRDQLQKTQMTAQKKQDLESRLEEETEKKQQANIARAHWDNLWKDLLKEAQCETDEALPRIEKQSRELQALQKELREIDNRLASLAGGRSIDELIEETRAIDADQLKSDLDAIGPEFERIDKELADVSETVGRLENELSVMDGNSEAAEAQSETAFTLSEIERLANEYATLRCASHLLSRSIQRYRDNNTGPILRRASDLFQRLTLGSFAALTDDFDSSGNPVLLGERPDGRRVPVTGMSEGTRDQLYLALRLAALEDYLQRHDPIPFIVDDILVMFDDDRAAAALEVLAEVAQHTQVIFFTHHQHLMDLANQRLDDDAFGRHQLEPRQTASPPFVAS